MQRHFVTGGTGFIGRNLVSALIKRNDKVYLLVRPSSFSKTKQIYKSLLSDRKNAISIIAGDITKHNLGISSQKLNDLKKIKFDYVWHLAANLAFNQNLDDRIRYRTNTIGTKNVIFFANKINSVLCHCSTAYVCGDSRFFSEKSIDVSQKFRNSYEYTKYLAEKLVHKESKVPFVIFRPSLVIDRPVLGKASNCTFGYYRYAYMFFLFRQWVQRSLESGFYSKFFLQLFGTKIGVDGKIKFKYLFVPYPNNIQINMVPIDYVIKSMLVIVSQKDVYGKTFNLTHPKPRKFIFLMKTIFSDLGIYNIHYLPLNAKLFNFGFKILYVFSFSLRGYMKSALMYLPYITTSPVFDRHNTNRHGLPLLKISKEYFSTINKKAFLEVFPKIRT